jgi:hypothetical protein
MRKNYIYSDPIVRVKGVFFTWVSSWSSASVHLGVPLTKIKETLGFF